MAKAKFELFQDRRK